MTEELEGCIFTSEKNKEFVGVKRTRRDWLDIKLLSLGFIFFTVLLGLIARGILDTKYPERPFLVMTVLLLISAFAISVMAAGIIRLFLFSRRQRVTIDYDTREVAVKTGLFTNRTADFSEIKHLEYTLYVWRDTIFGNRLQRRIELQLVLWNHKKLPLLLLHNESIPVKYTSERELLKRGKIISKRIASSLRVRAVLGKKVRE